jgi:hypothetical protein
VSLAERRFPPPWSVEDKGDKTGMFILPSGGPVMTKVLRCSDTSVDNSFLFLRCVATHIQV